MRTVQNKHWITYQLEASQLTAEDRLIKLFDLFEQTPDASAVFEEPSLLLTDLSTLAAECHIEQPASFAQQILLMAQEAWGKHQNNPTSCALQHAKIAAKALITAHKKNRLRRYTPAYAMAASVFLLAGVSGVMFGNLLSPAAESHKPVIEQQAVLLADNSHTSISNPIRITEMLSQRDKMREGRCQFPEAIVFSETERGIYLQNVVHGEISANREVQEVSSRLREFVRCDYTPMLMKKSVG